MFQYIGQPKINLAWSEKAAHPAPLLHVPNGIAGNGNTFGQMIRKKKPLARNSWYKGEIADARWEFRLC